VQKVKVRGGKLTILLSDEMRGDLDLRDGDEVLVSYEAGRIVVTPTVEEALPGDMEALDQAEEEFARGETRRIDDILHGLGRK
jgi:antitoxin component of MazEF toxin-antitoxin module